MESERRELRDLEIELGKRVLDGLWAEGFYGIVSRCQTAAAIREEQDATQ